MDIRFKQDTHQYFVDGIEYPSVSTIITGLAMSDFRSVPTHALEEGRARGTEVHAICESFDNGVLKIETIDERLAGYTKAWLTFCKDFKPSWVEIEKMLFSKTWGYCGRLDRVGIINGKANLLDIKTSEMKIPSNAIQSALYQIAYEEMKGVRIKERKVIHLSADGKYKIEEHNNKSDLSYAISAVQVYKWKRQYKQDADVIANLEYFKF